MTLGEYAQHWLAQRRQVVRHSTFRMYESHVRLHLRDEAIAGRDVATLTRGEVRTLLASWLGAGTKPSTVRTRMRMLHGIFAAAVDDELRASNPMVGMHYALFGRHREARGQPKALTQTEVERFFAAAHVSPLADYFFTLYQSGIRPGEGLALQWAGIEFARRRLHVTQTYSQGVLGPTKTGRTRYVDLSDALAVVLTARRAHAAGPWVFASPRTPDRPWSNPAVKKHFDRIRRAAGLRDGLTAHGLRHAWTTLLLEQQIPLAYVSRALGHASVSITADLYGASADLSHPAYLAALPPTLHGQSIPGSRKGVLLPFRRPKRGAA